MNTGLERKKKWKIVYDRSSPILIKHRKAILFQTNPNGAYICFK